MAIWSLTQATAVGRRARVELAELDRGSCRDGGGGIRVGRFSRHEHRVADEAGVGLGFLGDEQDAGVITQVLLEPRDGEVLGDELRDRLGARTRRAGEWEGLGGELGQRHRVVGSGDAHGEV